MMCEGPSAFLGSVQAGSVKLLAVGSPKRLPNFPDVPTIAETIPGFTAMAWLALLAPTGTPEPIIRKVNADLNHVFALPEIAPRLHEIGTYARLLSPAETAEFISSEQRVWIPVVRQVAGTLTCVRGAIGCRSEIAEVIAIHFFISCAICSIAGFHNCCWSRMNAASSSGDIGRTNDPRAASGSLTSGISSAARRPSLALAMIGSGVPFGANTASQLDAMRPGTVSAMVGRSGTLGRRRAAPTASGTRVPD
jgi:Tripartite tricarboxylate transporter family receptor